MDSEVKYIDLNALGIFKTMQDEYNSGAYMSKSEFLDDDGLIKGSVLATSLENKIATYADIYGLFYADAPDDDTTSED